MTNRLIDFLSALGLLSLLELDPAYDREKDESTHEQDRHAALATRS